GKILSEWETLTQTPLLPIGDGRTSRWEQVDKDNMVSLRLLCPNGQCGELGAPEGHRFIQLKSAGVTVGTVATRYTEAHIIGVITDINGSCFCRAWDYRTRQLLEFPDNIFNMQYLHIGRLSLEVQGVKI
ncbi:MAG: hypothetical protein MUO24_03590, partial [Desulfobacterales bacterium]|nr:hypothetical protein [Desulfobacterales bacterium]